MSLPTPYVYPDNTGTQEFWSQDGTWWNADVVNGGTYDLRVYGREYQGDGSKLIRWIIDCRTNDFSGLQQLLKDQGGDDSTTPRSLSLRQATEMGQKKGNGHANGN